MVLRTVTKTKELSQKYTNIIIDGQNFCWRAGVVENLTNKRGEPVYVSYVALKMLRGLVNRFKPKRVIVCWDGGHNAWRKNVYPDYKKRQDPTKEQKDARNEIFEQIQTVRHTVFPMFPVLQWKVRGQEADDLVYSAVCELRICRSESCLIVSSDQDYLQCLTEADLLSTITKLPYNRKQFEKDYGFPSECWPRYRALVGDSSDNLVGVKGIGNVGARTMMQDPGWDPVNYARKYPDKAVSRKFFAQSDIYERNEKLINLDKLPEFSILNMEFSKLLKNYYPTMDERGIKKYFVANTFQSMLKSFPMWIRPFKELT